MSNEEIIEKARNAVLEYDADSAVEAAEEAIKAGMNPVDVIANGFTKAMNEIAAKYEAKQLFLPHVVAASDAMTAGIDVLNPYLEKMGVAEGSGLGTIVIGTIEGDIHSIGKDITMLSIWDVMFQLKTSLRKLKSIMLV